MSEMQMRSASPDCLLDPWLARQLVCPRDKTDLHAQADELVCAENHRYSVVRGVPIMLLSGVAQTQREGERSLQIAADRGAGATVAGSAGSAFPKSEEGAGSSSVDPFVQQVIGATGGFLYGHAIGKLAQYPIPQLRLPPAAGVDVRFLDIGCNWGRWCLSAGRLGYQPVGIDHNLEAVLAARRVARQLGVHARYLVADGRYLPFRDGTFNVVFSYSVLQHFDKGDAERTIGEAGRVLAEGGRALIQMASAFGLRCLYHQARRHFRRPAGFEVRYWRPGKLKAAFTRLAGPTQLSVDGFLSLNPQSSDLHLLTPFGRMVVRTSEFLRSLSERFPAMLYVADSVYATAIKGGDEPAVLRRRSRALYSHRPHSNGGAGPGA